MAIAPRLDLRQTQTLVMTPQLRQAIKLLQYSNVEVASFVEEELERNPLLERDDSTDLPNTERAAPDQIPGPVSEVADAGGTFKVLNPPFRMSACAAAGARAAALGEHTREVLGAAGFSPLEIAALAKR